MNRFRNLIGIIAFSLMILALPSIASAQWRDDDYRNNRRNDDYRNGRYNQNLNSTIKNLKNRAKNFEKRIDRELDRSRYDGSNREDRINDIARDFYNATRDLDSQYDDRRDYNDSYNEAQRVLQLGNQLDRVLSRGRLSRNVQNEWSAIRQDLNVLARAYNYNNNNRNNRNRRGNNRNNNGDWRDYLPF